MRNESEVNDSVGPDIDPEDANGEGRGNGAKEEMARRHRELEESSPSLETYRE